MGDRANIVIEKDNQCFTAPVFFYTHGSGYRRKETLKAALERGRSRWDDAQYLSRIIFSEMIQGRVLDECGYGISTVLCDNSYPLLCVNIPEKRVREREPSENADGPVIAEWTFEEFLTLPVEEESEE